MFDCDGVLLESVEIKTTAFALLVEPFGDLAKQRMVDYHRRHGGVSRVDKVRWFYREVLRKSPDEAAEQAMVERFGQLVMDEVTRCAMVPGALEVLHCLQDVVPMHVCSGTPQTELQDILERRELSPFFRSIRGTPPDKVTLLLDIVQSSGIEPGETLMVGDSQTDLDAALVVGTRFYARGEALAGGQYPGGRDLCGLLPWLRAENNDDL